jgi:glycosyltransferase involved in cell wall biosynthesis
VSSPSALFVTTVPITLEMFLAPFAEHFRAEGWLVDALANGASENGRIADCFDNRYDIAWSRSPLDPRNLFGSAAAVRRIVAEGRYDLVHVHTPIAAFVTRWALRSMRKRAGGPVVVYTAHGFHFYAGQKRLVHMLYRTLERAAAHWTDFLVTINAEDETAARAFSGIPSDRVRRIPGIGVDTARFASDAVPAEEVAAVREGLGYPDDAFVLLMVAEFAPVKRHFHLLQAFAHVADKRVVLVLAGDGPLEGAVRLRAHELGLAERVHFAGYRRDIPALLAAADALVICSEREGLNRSVLEAMAAGRPVIGTATRGIADAIDEDAGWVVGKNDVAELAAAIDAAAADPAEVARRGDVARKRAEREFALPRIIDAYEELYREALASRL